MNTKRMQRLVRKLMAEGKKNLETRSEEGLMLVVFGDGNDNSTFAAIGSVNTSLSMLVASAHNAVKALPEGIRREYIDRLCAAIYDVCRNEVPHEDA